MKINQQQPLSRSGQVEQGKHNGRVQPDPAQATDKAGPAVVTHLSQAVEYAGQDIDRARVNEIRQAISEGRLELRADKIADGLLDSVRELLSQQSR
ncbi:flagellar biosynthesis anti-sigma factor FlgM [Zobellella aerophila]|uniref:Negative regulator of flagellin synthesis n=1 Tax=Zobellella aerophila TaxID=870480 RepID=A0ABP6VRY9_9GAMM